MPAGGLIARLELRRVEAALAIAAAAAARETLVGAAERSLGFDDVDIRLRQFVHESRGRGGLEKPARAAVLGKRYEGAFPGAGDADVSETALLFEALDAALVEAALMGKQPFLPTGEKHRVELEALGGVQRHQGNAVAVVGFVGVHDERNVLQEAFERVEVVHEAHELLQVLEPRVGLWALVGLKHGRIAGLVEDQLGQIGVFHRPDVAAPALDRAEQIAQRLARLRRQLFGLHHVGGGDRQGNATFARHRDDAVDRGVAYAPFRDVDDALELQVVRGIVDDFEIGDRVLDFSALVEPRTADDAVGHTKRNEAVLESAHLE